MFAVKMSFGTFGFEILFEIESKKIYEIVKLLFSNLIHSHNDLNFGIRRKNIYILGIDKNIHFYVNDILVFCSEQFNQEVIICNLIDIVANSFEYFYNNFAFFHGSVVAKENQCLLLIAPTHQGKTTIGTLLTLDGYTYLSDDVVIVNDKGMVFPFPIPIKLRRNKMFDSKLLYKTYVVIETTNYKILSYKQENKYMDYYFPKQIIFLNRCPNEDANNIYNISKFDAIQKLIINASYCKDLFIHTTISKQLSDRCKKFDDIIYNNGLNILEEIKERI